MATITLKAGMVWKGAYDASVTYDKLDVVCNADKTQIAVCKQGGSGIPLTNSNYWEVSIDASGIIALLEDALAHGEIYTMKIGSVTTGATSSATIVNNHQTHETVLNLVLEKGEKGDKGDKGERGEKGDTSVLDPEHVANYTLYNQTGNHTDGAMTQAAVTEEFEKLDEVYARNDGYYETMGVGMATNLKGQNTVDAEFAYRKSGGNVEVQDGNAMIEAIKGNTLAWNQLLQLNTLSAIKNVTFSNGVFTVDVTGQDTYIKFNNVEPIVNHKYYLSIFCSVPSGVTTRYGFPNASSNIITLVNGRIHWLITYKSGTLVLDDSDNSAYADTTFKDLVFIDLTLIYGEGNEPSTPEQFEQDYFNWFGKPLTYEPYDAGSLRNTKVSALKTVRFNLWDEKWEVGGINVNTGKEYSRTDMIRPINYINVIPNTEYYCAVPSIQVQSNLVIIEYDADKKFIKHIAYGSANRKFRTTTDTRYIRFIALTPTYNNDICINISDANRNGEYEPYKESTLPLDVTTLTGKLNGEGSSVVVFADGMNSAGDVHDEICVVDGVTKAIKRVSSSHEVLTEPEVYVLDDFNLPKLYPVANGGTEEQLSNSPNSLPATLSIRYGLNAAAFIQNAPKNYISKESMSNFLGNLGNAMGGTWSMTWNSSTNKYDFSFTQNRSVDVEQPIEDK